MNLNLISYPGPAKNIAEAHIEQRIQVPHVPLKFNSETEDVVTVAIIDDPIKSIGRAQDNPTLELFISLYNKTLEDAAKAQYLYHEDDVVNKTNYFIIDLFDKLNLDEQNYKTKTGRESLRNDVINKTEVHVTKYEPEGGPEQELNTKNYNLEKSWELYNSLLQRCIRLL
jgi:hypothetical protein